MALKKQVSGVFVAALTPMRADGTLELADLPAWLDFLARRGCHGALLLGTTGEGPSLSTGERVEIVRAAMEVRQAHPDFQLLVGTGTPSLEETISINRCVLEHDIDGVVVLPPYYFRNASEEGLFEWYSQVIRRSVPSGAAFLVYHIPGITGVRLTFELLRRLLEAFPGHVLGIKDSTTDPEHARQLGAEFGDSLLAFSGTDSLFDLALEHSASGCITAMGNLRSPDLRRVWDARTTKGVADLEAQDRLDRARQLMSRYPPNPPLYKALVHRIHGLPLWGVRTPLLNISTEQTEQILTQTRLELEAFEE